MKRKAAFVRLLCYAQLLELCLDDLFVAYVGGSGAKPLSLGRNAIYDLDYVLALDSAISPGLIC